MKTKIIIAGILLTLGAAALVAAGPVLAHPYWVEDGRQFYPPMWGWSQNYSMPYLGEEGYYCPGPYWANPDANQTAPYTPPENAPQRGYGCGDAGGWGGMMGRSGYSGRAPVGWSG
ncbi:hypothetical protein E4H04_08790 [Candidatus Bathyarchaeota archaeon]|jgi:hypothetical protein|nr:hypothetical protein [Candidatus Bathyarchaeota archaeon]TFH15197.1 MAG: hypothetical protein E4H04_08790 [Candidatus Bathyarchaeota archaeon]